MTTQLAQLLNQLTVVQLSAQSLALQCDQLITQLSGAELSPSPSPSPIAPSYTGAECVHPKENRNYAARTMGAPDRFLCTMCGELINNVSSRE